MNTHLSITDFRVKEYSNSFKIQRKRIVKKTTGYLWWKKSIEVVEWASVDEYGRFIFTNFNPYHSNVLKIMPPFNDLQSALNRINLIVEGCKYHYPNN